MDLEVLKKKISTFKGDGGRVSITSDEFLMEILLAWDQWTINAIASRHSLISKMLKKKVGARSLIFILMTVIQQKTPIARLINGC